MVRMYDQMALPTNVSYELIISRHSYDEKLVIVREIRARKYYLIRMK